jgi:putative sterol carrier protein
MLKVSRGGPVPLTVQDIFDRMPVLFQPDRAAGMDATVSYIVTGEGGGEYTCIVKDGTFAVEPAARPDATATVTISAEDWIALNLGTLDPMKAFFLGKLKARGNQGLLMNFPKLFRRPE